MDSIAKQAREKLYGEQENAPNAYNVTGTATDSEGNETPLELGVRAATPNKAASDAQAKAKAMGMSSFKVADISIVPNSDEDKDKYGPGDHNTDDVHKGQVPNDAVSKNL